MPIHKLPLIMAFNVQEIVIFIHKFSKNLPTVATPSPHSVASLPRFDPPMTNPGCIAKDTSPHAPPPPLIGTKEIFKQGVEDWYNFMPLHITYPLTMAFNVQKCCFHTRIFKNLPTGGRGETPSHNLPPPPPVDKFWLHHCHWHSSPPPPIDWNKVNSNKGDWVGDWHMPLHITYLPPPP